MRRPFGGVFRLGAFLLVLAAAPAAADCPAGEVDRRARVEHVVDGDTVVVAGRERLRLVGIDAPELGRDGAPSEPFARAARERVVALAGAGARLGLLDDRETRDHHGRLLAHLFLPDGRNLQALLLEEGLAVPLAVPPNLWGADCYRAAAEAARAAGRGLWGHPRLRPREAAELDPDHRGVSVVRGRVTRIGRSRHNLWLNLGAGFALRIPRDDLQYFPSGFPDGLRDRRVEALGRVYRRSGQLRMTLRHPSALGLLD
jgi:endonuclease YncB( thermonuclease family)